MKHLAILFLVLSGNVFATPFQVQSRMMEWRASQATGSSPFASSRTEEELKMPYISSNAPEVAMRINDTLYLSLVGAPAPVKPGKTFSLPEGVSPDGMTLLDFEVSRNDKDILLISVTTESCGAYCEMYEQSFNFDAHTGRALAADDLLTPQGMVVAAQRMLKERKRRYAKQIQELKQELRALRAQRPRVKEAESSDTEERIALNEDCLAGESEIARVSNRSPKEELDALRFSLPVGKGIVFTSSRCSAHVNRALDDVGEVELAIPSEELRSLLTPYGKALLLGEGEPRSPESPFGQVLHGKVGDARVTMRISRTYGDGSVGAIYYYDKYRKPVPLAGKKKGSTLEMVEHISETEQATFSLSLRRAGLVGQWRGKGKEVPVTLGW